MKQNFFFIASGCVCVFACVVWLATYAKNQALAEEERLRNGPCDDKSTLIATTAGSPSSAACSNQRHRMRVQPVTMSGEEIGAVVFCECERQDGGSP